ncbi:HEAT repeat domain-containing protein [Occallatibacter savannae]|uniref:HEAT repeat domain-containing protein n=1 Tax=Occallatibacter savannae TaxID=1002691 RepID=UPI0013A55A99|nr:HEAT repeat domain-containing protein [Occallatibacter savannae]
MPAATIDELFAQTLRGDYDDNKAWDAIHSLRATGSREVFDKAVAWCRSTEPLKRARGAEVLAQFGHTAENQTTLFAGESFTILAGMLDTETDPVALSAIVTAFGHLENPSIIPQILPFSYHSDVDVRYGLAFTLGCFADDERTVSTLIKLMSDKDSEVRDWATFGLGGLGNFDSPKIREALFKNLNDEDEDVREEALVGLARRKDPRSVSEVISALKDEDRAARALEAANFLLDRDREPLEDSAAAVKALRQQYPDQS